MKKIRVSAQYPVAEPKILLGLAAVSFLTAYYRYPLLFLLFALLFCYLAWCYLWTWLSCRYTGAESLFLGEKAFVGGTLNWKIRFESKLPFPLARCGVDFLLMQGLSCMSSFTAQPYINPEQKNFLLYLSPAWRRYTASYTWLTEGSRQGLDLQIKTSLRGLYLIPPPHFFAGDPSGLYQGRFQMGEEKFVTVYPHLQKAEEFLDKLLPEATDREDRFGTEDNYHIQGIRDYLLNDPPRSINWYATARTGSLKANMFQRHAEEKCLVVFDLSSKGLPIYEDQAKHHLDPTLEEAISLAAGIALHYLEKGASTSVITNAPTLSWEREEGQKPGMISHNLRRNRGIKTTGYGTSSRHAREILDLFAAVDQTSRAGPRDQEELWDTAQKSSDRHHWVYLIRYHDPPAWWDSETLTPDQWDPRTFYTTGHLAGLSTLARLRMINTTRKEE